MSTALIRIMVVLGIALSLATGTFASALNSLPDSPLYDVKLTMEQLRLDLLQEPAKIAEQHLALAQNRIQEMVRQSLNGGIPDQGTLERLQLHLAYSLHYAAQVQGEGMESVLVQAQNMAMNQHQILSQIQAQIGEPAGEPLGLAAQMMSQFSFQLAFGLGDPEAFRSQHQTRLNLESLQAADIEDCVPIGDENKYGPQPGSPAGPGEKYGNPNCELCDPIGDEHKYGQQSESSISPVSECQDCVPIGEENKYGPQPVQPGPGQPGGNPDCQDCDPDGDQNQYGPQPGELPSPGEPGGNPDCPNCDCPNCDCQNCDYPDCPCSDPDCDQNQNGKN